jgi:hypothetical protein
VLAGTVVDDFEDVAATLAEPHRGHVLDPDHLRGVPGLCRALRDNGATGVVNPRVRRSGDPDRRLWAPRCRHPPAGTPPEVSMERGRVDRYFDYQQDLWIEL